MEKMRRQMAREAKTVTRKEVVIKAVNKKITWLQAADILAISPRQMRRIKLRYENQGFDGLSDWRGGKVRRKRIALTTIEEICRLKREVYPDFSIQHFYDRATEKHGIKLSYTWTRVVLQAAGLVEKAAGRGKYRRKRERRPMVGMLLHLDGSTHRWLPDQPMADLIVMLDDADGRILYARFFPQEGTLSTFCALEHVVRRYGRFCELYTDRGSHFCRTSTAGQAPDEQQLGQVTRALKALGIRQILARSPEARGRSERAFGTIQGRLPQELRLAAITTYDGANRYLDESFVADFNRRFTVPPAQQESAFVRIAGTDLKLLFSIQHDRVVRNDSTVAFNRLVLQIPPTRHRAHYARCPVLVHEFIDETLGISYQGKLLARYNQQGDLLATAAGKAA